MISLDQVVLLQKKVEAAVAKINSLNGEIAQLKSENDALRRKCSELTNSLADKTGLVTSLEAEQNQIEQSILKALDQLDTVEDAVLATITSDVGGAAVESSVEVPVDQGSVVEEKPAESETVENQQEKAGGGVSEGTRILDPLALSFGQQVNIQGNQNQVSQNDVNQETSVQDSNEVQSGFDESFDGGSEEGKSDGGNQFDIF